MRVAKAPRLIIKTRFLHTAASDAKVWTCWAEKSRTEAGINKEDLEDRQRPSHNLNLVAGHLTHASLTNRVRDIHGLVETAISK